MKWINVLLLQLICIVAISQETIDFVSPVPMIATVKISNEITKGSTIYATAISQEPNPQGYPTIKVLATTNDGASVSFDHKKIPLFTMAECDNKRQAWDSQLIKNGTYVNFLSIGYQYDLRNELNNEANDYVNTLSVYDRFFNDEYLEDYIYSLVNKIYSGAQHDNRPGNIYVKILKDTEPNAFSLPNGCILISTGLLSTIQSEDELVGVLAHEIAHFALDHQVMNFNAEVARQKRAEFWATFSTAVAASADIYLATNNKNYMPGYLTTSTAIASTIVSEAVVSRLGLKYNQNQETEADLAAQELLKVLQYDSSGLSAALTRIKEYCILTGNYLALSASGSHPSLDSRISNMGRPSNLEKFSQTNFLKKVSFINSYNAWIELWVFAHHDAASELASRNINIGIATESDYIVKAVVLRRLNNTKESNEEVISLLNKARSMNVTSYILINKEEAITYLRLGKKVEAKKALQEYLTQLKEIKVRNEITEIKNPNEAFQNEIEWTTKMIFKVDFL